MLSATNGSAPAVVVKRDLEWELAWLTMCEVTAPLNAGDEVGENGLAGHAMERLEQGEREHGNRWARLGLKRFAQELSEESADLAAWAALAQQALPLEQIETQGERDLVTSLLYTAATAAAAAHGAAKLLGVAADRSGRTRLTE